VSLLVEKVKVSARGQVVIPKVFRRRLRIEHGTIIEIEETDKGLLLRPYNPVAEMKGSGKGVFGEPVEYQKRLRREWDLNVEGRSGH